VIGTAEKSAAETEGATAEKEPLDRENPVVIGDKVELQSGIEVWIENATGAGREDGAWNDAKVAAQRGK
jgi:hypothetical protein